MAPSILHDFLTNCRLFSTPTPTSSFNFGTLSIEQLFHEASDAGITKLALTDINTTSGVMDFIRLAPQHEIEVAVGIDLRIGAKQLYVRLAKNNEAFGS
ncbi:MAG: PHP domain-containing protein [Bacteroidetes bacterium]|nr:PHP domain-containing protein [Bacteroidota bacterium]